MADFDEFLHGLFGDLLWSIDCAKSKESCLFSIMFFWTFLAKNGRGHFADPYGPGDSKPHQNVDPLGGP